MAPTNHRVLVAGGGVAGLETLLALRDLARDRISLTLLTPEREFVYRPMSVAAPFARGHAQRHDIAEIAADLDVEVIPGALRRVDDPRRVAVTAAGEELAYDALVVAVGARSEPAFRASVTWTPELDAEVFGGLLRDLEEGYSQRIAFVVPPGVGWSLPAYELAMMTAWDARDMGQDGVEITVYTPEDAPLAAFGVGASRAVREDLDDAGVRVQTGAYVGETDGRLVVEPGHRPLAGTRVVALPVAVGPHIEGLGSDDRGFILCDLHARVAGTEAVWAAGDAIAFPIKQGGLAAQQADAAAQGIAARAGAAVRPEPFRPVLRGVVLTGRGSAWVRRDLVAGDSEGTAERQALWWPPTKIAGRYLAPYLVARDQQEAGGQAAPAGELVELDLERTVPAVADALRVAALREAAHSDEFALRRAEEDADRRADELTRDMEAFQAREKAVEQQLRGQGYLRRPRQEDG